MSKVSTTSPSASRLPLAEDLVGTDDEIRNTYPVELVHPHARNPTGFHRRPAASYGVRELARNLIERPKYRANLAEALDNGTCPTPIQTMLWYYAYGKPTESIEISTGSKSYEGMSEAQLQARALFLAGRFSANAEHDHPEGDAPDDCAACLLEKARIAVSLMEQKRRMEALAKQPVEKEVMED